MYTSKTVVTRLPTMIAAARYSTRRSLTRSVLAVELTSNQGRPFSNVTADRAKIGSSRADYLLQSSNNYAQGGRSYSTTSLNPSSRSNPSVLSDRYLSLVTKGLVHHDSHQMDALQALERLRAELLSYKLPPLPSPPPTSPKPNPNSSSGLFSSWFGGGGGGAPSSSSSSPSSAPLSSNQVSTTTTANKPPRGAYLHGGVGSGKTMLMNLFYESLNEEPWKSEKQKIHYHKFMATIHHEMHKARTRVRDQNVSDAVLPAVMELTAKRGRLICLDEFQVTDVADALILQRLFTGLWQTYGCIVVATSNRSPSDLYLGGLQRDRFLPFIDLLQDYCQEVSLWDSALDYRLIQKVESGEVASLWFTGSQGLAELDTLFYDELVTPRNPLSPVNLQASNDSSRTVRVPQACTARGIARFSFKDLCQTAMGASDYLVIGEHFSTVVVDQIPTISVNEVNWVRRFILLVDALYESNVKLILHAEHAKQPLDIFTRDTSGSGHDEVFAFDRTASRLQEMSSQNYLHRRWTGREKKAQDSILDLMDHVA